MSLMIMVALLMAAPQDQTVSNPAPAAQSTPAPGMKVKTSAGEEVGTVFSVDAASIVIDTGTRKVAFAPSSFTPYEGALLFGLTRAEVEEVGAKAEAEALSQVQSVMAVGAVVLDPAGNTVGTIDTVEEASAVVATGKIRAQLPLNVFAAKDGKLVIAVSKAQLEAQAGAK